MAKSDVYFCKGCSAVLKRRVEYCPHCGSEQYYVDECRNCGLTVGEEDEECPECGYSIYPESDNVRYCPWCGDDLDKEGRDLERKYCDGPDCGHEIGGLIRYNEEDGEPLSVDEIFKANDYEKEISDWLKCISNSIFGTYFQCFSERSLYIYDKSGVYSSNYFCNDFRPIFKNIDILQITLLDDLVTDKNLDYLYDKKYRHFKRYDNCLCVIDVGRYEEKTESHYLIEDPYGYVRPHYLRDDGKNFKLYAPLVFISPFLPEESKIFDLYDRHILPVTPDILEELDIEKIWGNIRMETL